MGKAKTGRAKIAAKAKGKVIHPDSRKAKQLMKKVIRKERGLVQAKDTNDVQHAKAIKIAWFIQNIADDQVSLSAAEIVDLIDRFIHRFQPELEELERESKGSKMSRYLALKTTYEQNMSEFRSGKGFEAPDLRVPSVIRQLRMWNGDLKDIHAFKMATFRKTSL